MRVMTALKKPTAESAPPPASGLRAAPLPTGLGMAERHPQPMATQRARLARVCACSEGQGEPLVKPSRSPLLPPVKKRTKTIG